MRSSRSRQLLDHVGMRLWVLGFTKLSASLLAACEEAERSPCTCLGSALPTFEEDAYQAPEDSGALPSRGSGVDLLEGH